MKLPAWGIVALLFTSALGIGNDPSGRESGSVGATATDSVAQTAETAINLANSSGEIALVERELSGVTGGKRADFLARYGRTSAASGRFDLGAAAYAMFLNEFGSEHEYSARIAMRFADCLFPFNFRQIDVVHTASGPRLEPTWRMQFSPRPERLRQAVRAYELAASIAGDSHAAGIALLRLGWLHRVLNDWDASTEAWDRCAHRSSPTKSAADALWLAAENLVWTDQPSASADRLRLFAAQYADDARAAVIPIRIEHLEAEAQRSSDWLIDAVGSLTAEIEARSAARKPYEVYRSVVKWLERKRENAAIIVVSRWACAQNEWTLKVQIACRYDLVDASLLEAAEAETGRREAAARLGEIVELATNDATAVPAALRRYHLLVGMARPGEADGVANEIAARVKGSRRWERVVLTELIESLLQRGEKSRAKRMHNALVKSHPGYGSNDRFDAAFHRMNTEGSE